MKSDSLPTSVPLPAHVENYDMLMDMFKQIGSNDWIPRGSLDYFRNILALLGNPEKNLGEIIYVTGTNGKGSVTWKVARSIEANFPDARVARYVSPNIYEFEERITINGNKISQDDMIKYTNVILNKLHSKSSGNNSDTINFRIGMVGILVCIAFLYFRDQKVEYSVIEGGIGIKLDHTNVILPAISVITSIGLDHVKMLGDTVEKIAADKAHIIKSGIPVVIGPRIKDTGNTLTVIKAKAEQEKLRADQVIIVPPPSIQNFEIDNQETAKAVLDTMFGSEFKITDAIFSSPPGRYQKVLYSVEGRALPCIFDVGHNPDGFEAVFARCSKDFPDHKFILMFGINPKKNISEICSQINEFENLSHVLLYTDNFRLLEPSKISPQLNKSLNVQDFGEIKSIDDYLKPIVEKSNEPCCIIVIGSFYTVKGISEAMHINLYSLRNRHIPGNNERIGVVPEGAKSFKPDSSNTIWRSETEKSPFIVQVLRKPIEKTHSQDLKT